MKTALVEFLPPFWVITKDGLDRLEDQSSFELLPPPCPFLINPGSNDLSYSYITLFQDHRKTGRLGGYDYGEPENFLLSEIMTDEQGYVISLKIHSAVVVNNTIEEMTESDQRWIDSIAIYNQLAADDVVRFTILD